MLSSEKAIFENYNCGDLGQRQNAAVTVKTMHQNGLHDILPVLYRVASILATIPATSCSAERSFSALRRIKTFLRSTVGQDRLSSIALLIGSFSNDDGDGGDDAGVKNGFIFYLRMSQLCKSAQFAYRS